MSTVNVTMRMDRDLVERVDAIAEKLGETRTYVIERAVRLGLPETERFLKALSTPVVGHALEMLTRPGVLAGLAALAGESQTEADRAADAAVNEKIKRVRGGHGRKEPLPE